MTKAMEEWICVYSSAQRSSAELVKSMLAGDDIEAVIVDKKDSVRLVQMGEVEVYVQPENENLAVELIKEMHLD